MGRLFIWDARHEAVAAQLAGYAKSTVKIAGSDAQIIDVTGTTRPDSGSIFYGKSDVEAAESRLQEIARLQIIGPIPEGVVNAYTRGASSGDVIHVPKLGGRGLAGHLIALGVAVEV